MRSYGKYILCFLCGFLLALSAHPVWGKSASAILGISLAILFACLAKAGWRYALLLLLPIPCVIGTFSIGTGLGTWIDNNTPEQVVMGDISWQIGKCGSCFAKVVLGSINLVKTGDPDSLAKSGVQAHHFIMLAVILFAFFALFCCAFKYRRKRAQEMAMQVDTARVA